MSNQREEQPTEAKDAFDVWMRQGFNDREARHIEFCRTYASEYAHGAPGHMDFMVIAGLAALLEHSDPSDKRELLAAYAHEAWAGWMVYLFGKCKVVTDDGSLLIPAASVARWGRQMRTPYADLPENEKESDRAEADKMLAIVRGL